MPDFLDLKAAKQPPPVVLQLLEKPLQAVAYFS